MCSWKRQGLLEISQGFFHSVCTEEPASYPSQILMWSASTRSTCLSIGDPVVAHGDTRCIPLDHHTVGGGGDHLQVSRNIRN